MGIEFTIHATYPFYLVHRLPNFRSTSDQNTSYFFDCFPVRPVNQVCVMLEGNPRICVAKLALCDLGSGTCLEECRGVHVAKRMETRPGNPQRIAQRPQSILDNLLRGVRPATSVDKEESTAWQYWGQELTKSFRHRHRGLARDRLRGLQLPVPNNTLDANPTHDHLF